MYSHDDRSWMYDMKYDNGELKDSFTYGVQKFLEFASCQINYLDLQNYPRCPCRKCDNRKFLNPDQISIHLCRWGFVPQYYTWVAHGETSRVFHPSTSGVGQTSDETIVDDIEGDEDQNPFSELVYDAFQVDRDSVEEEPNPEARKFYELLRQSEERLQSDKDKTVLQWVAEFLAVHNVHNIPVAACNKFLHLAKDNLPPVDDSRLPDNVYGLKKMMSGLGLGYKTYDVCVNNCFLYYGDFENSDYTECPECGEARYAMGKKKPISRKKLWYFPIIPRLQRLYMSATIAKHMTWHTKCSGSNEQMIHPACGEAWKHFDSVHPEFASEPRNIRLGLCSDGFTPFGSSSVPYSCWPVFVTPYNLPPDLCMRQEYIFLSLIISGPKSPGKNINVLLRPLVDDLRDLWVNGVDTYDRHLKQNFRLFAALIWTISDYPAYAMLSQWSTAGRLSCPYCMENTQSFQLKHGRKTCFFDCHRRFLPPDHVWRRNKKDFIKGRQEFSEPAPRRSGNEMRAIVDDLPEDMDPRYHIPGYGVSHNWCGRSIFWDLPYWETNLIRHNLDVMHCEKNFFDNIKNTVMDDSDKSKDNFNARRDLQILTRRKELFLKEGADGKVYKQKATYCLNRDQKRLVLEWLKGLRFPDGYASNISRCVQMPQLKLTQMKSHDCHVFMQRLIPIAFRDFLPDAVWGPLAEISLFFRTLCSSEIRRSDMERLESSIVETMCKLEKIFPPAFFDSMEHLAIHLPYEAKVGGPVQYRWMYPFERRMFELKRSAGNKARVEGSICHVYLLSEMTHIVSQYFGDGVETRYNRLNRNETALIDDYAGQLSIFHKQGKPIGSVQQRRYLTESEFNLIELYTLLNCPEVDGWVILFQQQMCQGLNEQQTQTKRNALFVEWFKNTARSGYYEVDTRLNALIQGPSAMAKTYKGYKVNGFRFHTESHSIGSATMNSGVCVKASLGSEEDTNFYGMIQDILEVDFWGYGRQQTIVYFKCDWYDIPRSNPFNSRYRLVDINPRSRLQTNEPFIFANQSQQVYYTPYPSASHFAARRGWWAVCTTRARYIIDTTSLLEGNASETEETTVETEILQDAEPSRAIVVDTESHDYNLPIALADTELQVVDPVDSEESDDDND